MSTDQTAVSYQRHLGDGLLLRWSTADDADKLADLMGLVWRSGEDESPNLRMMESIRRHLRGDFPLMGPGDCAVIEDTKKAGSPIVACACLWRQEWTYAGIPFSVGRPEDIATDPGYRNRGLVRALMDVIHARSAAEGHLVQVISGIPYFYRQFGYEYVLDFGGKRVTYLPLIPEAHEHQQESYTLREATTADIPRIMEIYNYRRASSLIWAVAPEQYWRYMIERWSHPSVLGKDPTVLGMNDRILMIVDAEAAVCGYVVVAVKRWGADLLVYALELAPDLNVRAVVPPLLRALLDYGLHIPAIRPEIEPLREISFLLGRSHSIYEGLGRTLAPYHEPPYAWYVRVPDVPAFIRRIVPVLEQRVANSVMVGYTGELKINFYQGGLRVIFDHGRVTAVDPWRPPVYSASVHAGFPPLVFLQLLFGYRSLDELRYAFPDVWASDEGELLLNALCPACPSYVMQL